MNIIVNDDDGRMMVKHDNLLLPDSGVQAFRHNLALRLHLLVVHSVLFDSTAN